VLLAAALRAFEDTTAGGAVVAAENYRALGFVNMTTIPSYNTLLREFAKPVYMPLLHKLVAGSAWPLIGLESKFAIDGTGFGSGVYDCYLTEKHGSDPKKRRPPTKRHRWVDARIVFGTTTHVVAAVQITEPNTVGASESELMPTLLKRTIENGGRVSEWLADAAYMSWYNVDAVEEVGAVPYIDFPERVTGVTRPSIRRLYNRFQADKEEYQRHYHQRSHAETGNSMIKTRFSHWLRSRKPHAQYAESMLRCIGHNVACLVQAVEELGIEPRGCSNERRRPELDAQGTGERPRGASIPPVPVWPVGDLGEGAASRGEHARQRRGRPQGRHADRRLQDREVREGRGGRRTDGQVPGARDLPPLWSPPERRRAGVGEVRS
jgi:transposase